MRIKNIIAQFQIGTSLTSERMSHIKTQARLLQEVHYLLNRINQVEKSSLQVAAQAAAPAVPLVVPYTVYRALLTQSVTGAPTADMLETSTLSGGTPTWSYEGQGIYYLTSTGSFTDATKVEINIESVQNIWNISMSTKAVNLISATRLSADVIEVKTSGLETIGGTTFQLETILADNLKNSILNNSSFVVKVWS